MYVVRNYRPVRIFPVRAYSIHFKNIPCIIARRVLTPPFPLLSSPESTVIEVFLVSVFHACPQFSFVVPTVECIRGYNTDRTIYSLF